jgi:nitroreductase
METLDAVLTRRSIRKFADRPVSQELVDKLLHAAMAAPSAGNQQPWHFVVVRDRELLDQLSTTSPFAASLRNAPMAIAVCADPRLEKHRGFWVQDCAAATQNMLVAAHDLGLGACWLGYHPVSERTKAARSVLGLPNEVELLCLVPVGHPEEKQAPADRYDAERVHTDGW